jgi:hypothetical protein
VSVAIDTNDTASAMIQDRDGRISNSEIVPESALGKSPRRISDDITMTPGYEQNPVTQETHSRNWDQHAAGPCTLAGSPDALDDDGSARGQSEDTDSYEIGLHDDDEGGDPRGGEAETLHDSTRMPYTGHVQCSGNHSTITTSTADGPTTPDEFETQTQATEEEEEEEIESVGRESPTPNTHHLTLLLSVDKIPWIPGSADIIPRETQDLIMRIWRDGWAGIRECRCRICERGKRARAANSVGVNGSRGLVGMTDQAIAAALRALL